MTSETQTLVLGWGNPARLDDGLGPAFVDAIEAMGLTGVATDCGYQLQVEDADDVSRYQRVIFVDADRRGIEPFSFRRLAPTDRGLSFSTHSVAPGAILALSRDLFDASPEAWLLGIRGYDFDDFGERLSAAAKHNLAAALEFARDALEHGELHDPTPTNRRPRASELRGER